MTTVNIPVPSQPIVGSGGLVTKPWYDLLQQVASRANALSKGLAAATDLTSEVTGVLMIRVT